jgi:hypothetical protein
MGQLDLVIGVLLIGLFFNTYLYGLVTYQFIVYYNTKFNDRLWIKAVVGSLFVLDTIHSAVAIFAAWELCVTNYGNPASLASVSWTIPFTAVATALAAIITQFFLGHRVYVLTKNIPVTVAIGVLSILGFIFGTYAGIYSGILKEVAKFTPLEPLVICWLGFQTAADLLITSVLCFVLSSSRTGFRRTDTIINRLIRGAVQTGVFACIFALADMFSFLLHRETYLYAMFAYPLGRIYTNTLLDTLNARTALQSAGSTENETDNVAYRLQNQTHAIHVQKDIITQVADESDADKKYKEFEV